jgi:hypothetical protein
MNKELGGLGDAPAQPLAIELSTRPGGRMVASPREV